ncbi:hypothetical protein Q3G72_009540 [Acer saccharum]|nr:hypothetical protein Q3G72_009540 [Acer saccharum]
MQCRSSVDERVDGDASDKPLDIAVLTRMKQFREMNKLKKVSLKVIVENLSSLKEMFKSMDTDTSGTITYEELKAEIQSAPSSSASATATTTATPHAVGRVLGRPMEDVRSTYIFGRELGRGQFGVTYLVTHKETKQQFACKSIATRKLINRDDIEDVRREVQIMHHLTGHRNIVELKAAYEDRHSVNLNMELCAGGELFDRIIAKGHYSERAAANLCRQMVTVVHYCHSMGVMHRDLKPENFLLLSADEDSPLKAMDFRLSVFFGPGEVFRDLVGSAYYVAPEVLRRSYGAEADIWSAGVILYILLRGVPPFWGAQLLKMQCRPLDIAVLTRMKQFRAMNKLKKVALKVIAENLSEEEIMGLKEIFKSMDTDNSGTITYVKS